MEISHNKTAGFFSNCTIILYKIIRFYNKRQKLPKIDCKNCFYLYKNEDEIKENKDIYEYFFEKKELNININFIKINFNCGYQFKNYKMFDSLNKINEILNIYFSPSKDLNNLILINLKKFNLKIINNKLINYCSVYYRSTDKITETKIPSIEEMKNKIIEIKKLNNKMNFIIQSDNLKFINEIKEIIPNCIYLENFNFKLIKDNEAIHLNLKENVKKNILNFLSIIKILSYSEYLICNSCNVSLWINLFRNNINNVHQYLNGRWI